MRRRLVLYGGSWVVATAVATGMTWAGVAYVAGDVTGEHTVRLEPAEVSGLVHGTTTTATTTPPPTSSTPAATRSTATTAAPVAAAGMASPPTPSTAVPVPPTAATSRSPEAGETFAAHGGTVSVSCDRDDIAIVSSRPFEGRTVRVIDDGPRHVVVGFDGPDDDELIVLECERGTAVVVDPPDERDDRGDRDGGADDDGDGGDRGDRGDRGDEGDRDGDDHDEDGHHDDRDQDRDQNEDESEDESENEGENEGG